MRHARILSLATGLALLASAAAHAQVAYQLQPIAKLGDTIAGIKSLPGDAAIAGNMEFGPLNDNGQVAINFESAKDDGSPGGEFVVEYSAGKFNLVFAPGL